MNKVILMGRLVRDPELRYSPGVNQMAVARYTLAVDRVGKKNKSEQTADFIPCVAFGNLAEFANKYFKQGLRVLISGHIQTGSYTNRDGQKVYTSDVLVESQEFADGKAEEHITSQTSQSRYATSQAQASNTGFMHIPDGVDDDALPFD